MRTIEKSEKEIDSLLNRCDEQSMIGGSKLFGMTYEEGVAAGIRWILGEESEDPLE